MTDYRDCVCIAGHFHCTYVLDGPCSAPSARIRWTRVDRGYGLDYVTPLTAPRTVYDGIATQVKRWYNAYERSWVVSLADADGHQVGGSEYVYSRADADAVAADILRGA